MNQHVEFFFSSTSLTSFLQRKNLMTRFFNPVVEVILTVIVVPVIVNYSNCYLISLFFTARGRREYFVSTVKNVSPCQFNGCNKYSRL